jgi:hypothetical protein
MHIVPAAQSRKSHVRHVAICTSPNRRSQNDAQVPLLAVRTNRFDFGESLPARTQRGPELCASGPRFPEPLPHELRQRRSARVIHAGHSRDGYHDDDQAQPKRFRPAHDRDSDEQRKFSRHFNLLLNLADRIPEWNPVEHYLPVTLRQLLHR